MALPLLIGKNGKTLENIQFYIRNLVNSFSDERFIVLVDIGGYKENRKKQLEIIATKTAKEVARTRVEIAHPIIACHIGRRNAKNEISRPN